MGHWIKHYADGSRYVGDDVSVRRKERSWTRSNNEGIVSVTLEHKNMKLQLLGPGQYWQSDTFEVALYGTRPRLTKRRIERQIQSADILTLITKSTSTLVAKILTSDMVFPSTQSERKMIHIDDHHIGQWLILEMDLLTNQLHYYIHPERI